MQSATPLLDWAPPAGPRDGATFDPWRDESRLNRQQLLVWRAIKGGAWRTLADMAAETGCPEASISARLRDFRKPRFGGLTIDREYVGDGLWRYRLRRDHA